MKISTDIYICVWVSTHIYIASFCQLEGLEATIPQQQ